MCGRYELSDFPAALAVHFALGELTPYVPSDDVRPTQVQCIIRRGPGLPRVGVSLRWGLVPAWAKDLKFGLHCVNARAETVAEKPAFRAAFRHRRCLVPANAFYEWAEKEGTKQKYKISIGGGELFAMAGLWDSWTGPEEEVVETFTIITCDANALLRNYHARMPVILDPKDYDFWLDPANPDLAGLKALLKSYPEGKMAAQLVPANTGRSRNRPWRPQPPGGGGEASSG